MLVIISRATNKAICDLRNLLVILNQDFARIEVCNYGERLLRKIDSSLATRWWTVIHDRYRHALARTRLQHTLVRGANASNTVHGPARGTTVPQSVACRADHVTHVCVLIASRS